MEREHGLMYANERKETHIRRKREQSLSSLTWTDACAFVTTRVLVPSIDKSPLAARLLSLSSLFACPLPDKSKLPAVLSPSGPTALEDHERI